MEKKRFGLLGKNISYSFSKKYFEEKFRELGLENDSYEFFDFENLDDIESLFSQENLVGFNVTIPYKQEIIPYLTSLSEEAEKIGAVNTVKISGGEATGFNTDAFGFEQTLLKYKKPHHDKALILGNGGAAKAVKFVLGIHDIPYETVCRKGKINFENLTDELVRESKIIIQCTPVGTFPDIENSVKFPFNSLSDKHLAIDLIYNPSETKFLKECRKNGAETVNGQLMLEMQAEKSWEIWYR